MRTAVIAGATGLVGRHCLSLLLGSRAYGEIHALVRRPLPIENSKLRQRIIDFDKLAEVEFPVNADAFCALGSTIRLAGSKEAFRRVDFGYVAALARKASECGSPSFAVVSSVSAARWCPNFYLRVKADMEDAVSALPFASVAIFRPSFILGQRDQPRTAEKFGMGIASAAGVALIGPLAAYKPIAAETIAKAMVSAALRPEPGKRVYEYKAMATLAECLLP